MPGRLEALPEEIQAWLTRYNEIATRFVSADFPPLKPDQLKFYEKAKISRCEAWTKTVTSETNYMWRKHHTEHYWCWVLKEETRPESIEVTSF